MTPIILNKNITIINDGRGYYYVISNGTGYSFLSEIFALGTSLQKNEILYFPFEFQNMNAYKNDFLNLMETHYSGLILFNYCTAQYTVKDIITSIKTKTYYKDLITRTCEFSSECIEGWKIHKRTSIKESGPFIIISTNADGFTSFAQLCCNLADYGDNAKYNECPPHMHRDRDENTSKSLGITLYYWQSPETSVQ